MNVGERIKQRREDLGISAEELGRRIGKAKTTIYRYETGYIENMPSTILEPIAKALLTTPAYLMGWNSNPNEGVSIDERILRCSNVHPIETRKIPMIGSIACGKPIMCEQEYDTFIETGADIRADVCMTCCGDSMIGARIFDGDIVFIHRQPMVNNGEIAAVIIDNEATLKRVYYYPEKHKLVLQAENPKYEPLVYMGEELNEIEIYGKAVFFQSNIK